MITDVTTTFTIVRTENMRFGCTFSIKTTEQTKCKECNSVTGEKEFNKLCSNKAQWRLGTNPEQKFGWSGHAACDEHLSAEILRQHAKGIGGK